MSPNFRTAPLNPRAASRRTSSQVTSRTATFADYEQIAALERRYKLVTKTYDDWIHLWTANPVYKQLGHDWPIGWVLEVDNKIVGHFGNIPLGYELEGDAILAASGRAWVVDAEYRGYSILLLDHFLHQSQVDLFLNTTANAEAYSAFLAFGAYRVPVGSWDRTAMWICQYSNPVRAWLREKRVPQSGLIRYPLSACLFARDLAVNSLLSAARTRYEVVPCTSFDERFETFWAALRKKRSKLLVAVRSQEALAWHFYSALRNNKLWILTLSKKSQIIAYSVFLTQQNRSGQKLVLLADLQTLDDSRALPGAMLSFALHQCRQHGIDLLIDIGLCLGNGIGKRAPYKRTREWSYLYQVQRQCLAHTLSNAAVWAPSVFDGDATL